MALQKFSGLTSKNAKLSSILPKVDQDGININATKTTFDQVFDITREIINVGPAATTDGGASFVKIVSELPTNKGMMQFYVEFEADALAGATLDLGFGAKPITTQLNNGQQIPVDNDVISSSGSYLFIYTGAVFILLQQKVYTDDVIADPTAGNIVTVTPVVGTNGTTYKVYVPTGAVPETVLIIDLTVDMDGGFAQLKSLKASNALKTGYWYKFVYQCIHKIPGTNILNTDPTVTVTQPLIYEQFIVRALSPNQLCETTVKSLSYPEDIIHWRDTDDAVIDQNNEIFLNYNFGLNLRTEVTHSPYISYLSPAVTRPGRIYYREDTIQRVSSPYDFRAVVYQRKAVIFLSGNIALYMNSVPLTIGYVSDGTIILAGGAYYLALKSFTATTTNVSDYSSLLMDITITYANKYVATNDYGHTVFTFSSGTQVQVAVNPSDVSYFRTFRQVGVNVNAYNVEIKDFVSAYIESIAWEFYPDIVFLNDSGVADSNVIIEGFSYDMTINGAFNMNIGAGSRNITMEITGTQLGDEVIEIGRGSNFINLLGVTKSHDIGIGCSGICTYNSIGRTTIGNYTESTVLISTQSSGLSIGDNNENIACYVSYGNIGNSNFYVGLIYEANFSVGNLNRNLYDSYSYNGSFGNENSDISLNASAVLIEGITGNRVGDTIGSSCDLITIFTAGNNRFENAKNITTDQDKYLVFIDSDIVDSEDITLTTNTTLPLVGQQHMNIFAENAYTINVAIASSGGDFFGCTVKNCDTVNINGCFSDDGLFYIEGVFNTTFTNVISDIRHRIQKIKECTFENLTLLNGQMIDLFGCNLKNLNISTGALMNLQGFVFQPASVISVGGCFFTNLSGINLSGITATAMNVFAITNSSNISISGAITANNSNIIGTQNIAIQASSPVTIKNMTIDNAGDCTNPATAAASIVDITALATLLANSQMTAIIQDSVVPANVYLCGTQPSVASAVLTITPIKTIVA